ncbi:F-box/LRR-repeat protein 3-like [Vicia villosa]|uniref:F-box/LRR-repeat protein 3-like n=1 Tax=Vicia villosa TaxID=3911 RepID=UPI00273C6722|nr:F-box/LRR-repeat protein 3-like [Vicia villosa]
MVEATNKNAGQPRNCSLDRPPKAEQVLQLDNCGCIITDETVSETLAKPNHSFSKLTHLSIVGAFDLSDAGLRLLVSSVKTLTRINISKCISLTATALDILADSFGSTLEELYMGNFNLIDTHRTLQALKRLKQVKLLSLAGIRDLSDGFIQDYIKERGRDLTTLVLKDCVNLTDVSMNSISSVSRKLRTLDISNLGKLTDLSLEFVKIRLRGLTTLKLDHIPFSDKAIAVYLDYVAGENLEELSLNSNENVGYLTAFSLGTCAEKLHTLDLSHYQNLTDRDVGMIVNGCSSLRTLTIVGCSKLTGDSLSGSDNLEIRHLG